MTAPAVTGWRAWFSEDKREWFYRLSAGLTGLLFAFGVLQVEEASLWAQLVTSTVTLVFALAYSTSGWRSLLYGITGPLGAVLMWYGIVQDVRWALIVSAVGQVFGITTAAAKTVQSTGRHARAE